jgi:Asp-tRNA(Asn)/Glu-tRNA(Gln) amidotransferase A subunit family amidase
MCRPKPTIENWRQRPQGHAPCNSSLWKAQLESIDSDPFSDSVVVDGTLSREIAQAESTSPGPLAGVPYLTKDLFDLRGYQTTASSRFLGRKRGISSTSAAIVRWLHEQGAICQGKTHLNEFAYGLDGANSHYGSVPNPLDPELICGGSSSGSAYAVARGWVPFAIGTDTGGSIRVPAAYCGLYGFRMPVGHPWGYDGCFPLAPSFDTAGWFTRSASDMQAILSAVQPETIPNRRLTVAIDSEFVRSLVEDDIYEIWRYSAKNWPIVQETELSPPVCPDEIRESFNQLQSREALSIHEPFLTEFGSLYDPSTLEKIERARHWSQSAIDRAQTIRSLVGNWLSLQCSETSALLLPAVPSIAPGIHSGMSAPMREAILNLTSIASIAGHPVLCLPAKLSETRTTGFQLILPKNLNVAICISQSVLVSWQEHPLNPC